MLGKSSSFEELFLLLFCGEMKLFYVPVVKDFVFEATRYNIL